MLRFLRILLLPIYANVIFADETCDDPNAACGSPFPPGHLDMGPSWWGIGDKDFDAYIEIISTALIVPQAPEGYSGIIAINPALENSVSKSIAA